MRSALVLSLVAGCRLPVFDHVFDQYGLIAQDYRVDRLRVLAVHTVPPLAIAGEPRTVEALVVAPGGTRRDARVEFGVCGLLDVGSVGVSDLRCFENPDLVARIGVGNPVTWDVPAISFPACVPFDSVGGGTRPDPGDDCASVVPVLATATGADGSVAAAANTVVVPGVEVPETLTYQFSDTGAPEEGDTTDSTVITSFADPALAVSVAASGPAKAGERLDLVATIEDVHYNHVAWWVDAGTLDQSGRTLIVDQADGTRNAYNRLILPKDAPDHVTVWIVVNEWFDIYEDPPNPSHIPTAQPAWAELTLEVTR